MLFVNILGVLLQLDELIPECPVCAYRYEQVQEKGYFYLLIE